MEITNYSIESMLSLTFFIPATAKISSTRKRQSVYIKIFRK